MSRRPLLLVGGLVAALAAAYAVRRLLEDPAVRNRLGLPESGPEPHYGDEVDMTGEDSFPASDPPNFSQPKAAAK